MRPLFVYGTLRHPPLLDALVGRPVPQVPAVLPGHRAAPLAGRPYPGLVVEAAGETTGAVVEVDDDELATLDEFEGPDYERVEVAVVCADAPRTAATYLLVGPAVGDVRPGSWSLEAFLRDAAEEWVRRLT